jgi:fumarate hydratase class II
MSTAVRIERDTMGEMQVPADAYFAAQTARAIANFPISGLRFPRPFIAALGYVKAAAARANVALDLLPRRLGGEGSSERREVATASSTTSSCSTCSRRARGRRRI